MKKQYLDIEKQVRHRDFEDTLNSNKYDDIT